MHDHWCLWHGLALDMIGAVVPQGVRADCRVLDFDVQCALDGCEGEWLDFVVLVMTRTMP